MRLIQLVVLEGNDVAEDFAALHGLHHTDVEALTLIMVAQDRGSPLTAGALARELRLTSGAITFLVDRLVHAGHLTRVRSDADRRKVFLHYSPAGRALADEFFGPFERLSQTAMDQFTPEQLGIIHRFLAVTAAAMADHRRTLRPVSAQQQVPRQNRPNA